MTLALRLNMSSRVVSSLSASARTVIDAGTRRSTARTLARLPLLTSWLPESSRQNADTGHAAAAVPSGRKASGLLPASDEGSPRTSRCRDAAGRDTHR